MVSHAANGESRYCPEIAELFDAEFSTITALTYKRIGDEEGINTTHVSSQSCGSFWWLLLDFLRV